MVPEGWKRRPLADVVDFLDGMRRPLKSEDRASIRGEYPYYGATGIIDWVNDFIFDEPLVLMGEDGENIVSRNLPHVFKIQGKTWVNNHAHVLRPKSGCHIDYLCSYLESIDYRKYNTGTAQPKLNKKSCESIPVLVPPPREQAVIAKILSTWDRAIETVQKIIGNSQVQMDALSRQLLTGLQRLEGFSGKFPHLPVSNVANITTGSSNRVDSDEVGEFTFFDRSTEVRRSDKFLFDAEAIIVGGEGKEFIPKYFEGKFDLHQRAYAILDFENAVGKYLYYAIHLNRHLLKRFSVGSTVSSLRMGTFDKLLVWLPSVDEQRAISKVLSTCDQEIAARKHDLDLLKSEKSALMQQLLTGMRRVKVDHKKEAVA